LYWIPTIVHVHGINIPLPGLELTHAKLNMPVDFLRKLFSPTLGST
jgi:hypothetical protein